MNQKQIDKIIVKLFDNTISDKESEVLKKWLQYEDNLSYFNQFVEINHLTNSLTRFSYELPLEKVLTQTLVKPKKFNALYKYGIAASLILFVTFNFIFNKNNLIIDEPVHQPETVNNKIEAGTDKAILTLEDGSYVALEKGQEYSTNNLTSNGEELIYVNSNSNKTEIAFNYLTIPRGGQYFIKLSDGTQVWLNSESQLKYPVRFINGETRKVELVYGEAYFDVSPSEEHGGDKFSVLNNGHEVNVLGTEFNIKAYKDESHIYTTLIEGLVAVKIEDKEQNLKPNQQSSFNLNTNALSVAVVDVYNETSWKDGLFSFERKPLKDIMKVLSRWYDMEVVFVNNEVGEQKFIGVLGKDQNIEEILSIIKNFKIIKNYEIKDKTILLE